MKSKEQLQLNLTVLRELYKTQPHSMKWCLSWVAALEWVLDQEAPSREEFSDEAHRMDTKKELTVLGETIRSCEDCELCKKRENAVPGRGNYKANLMVVVSTPSKADDKEGRIAAPGINQTGATDTSDVWISSAVRCRPGAGHPTRDQLSACNKYLAEEIQLINPAVILACGKSAIQSVLGPHVKEQSIQSLRGVDQWHLHRLVVPTHDLARSSEEDVRDEIIEDVERAQAAAQGTYIE